MVDATQPGHAPGDNEQPSEDELAPHDDSGVRVILAAYAVTHEQRVAAIGAGRRP